MADPTKLPHGLPREALVGEIKPKGKGPSAKQKHLEMVTQGLRMGYPAGQTPDLPPADPLTETQMVLTIDEIRIYEHNPRRSTSNPQYQEIKESIRTAGLHNTLSITRRPGDAHYIIEAGGNTRLQILRELWEETKDEKFYRLSFVFRPWQSESAVLSKHLVENNLRGEMTFWDNASGVMDLKSQMEGELGGNISNLQFDGLLKKQGLTFSKTDVNRFTFATERLSPLGYALPFLTARIVTDIQPRFNLYKRFFEKHEKLDEINLYTVLDPAMAAYGDRFSAAADSEDASPNASSTNEPPPRFDVEELTELCHAAVAAHCGEDVNWLKTVLDGLKINPNADLESLRPRASSGATEAPGGVSQGFMGDGKEEGESGYAGDGDGESENASCGEDVNWLKTVLTGGASQGFINENANGGENDTPPTRVAPDRENPNSAKNATAHIGAPASAIPATTLPATIPHEDPEPEAETSFQEFLLERILSGVKTFAEGCDATGAITSALFYADDLAFGYWMEPIVLVELIPPNQDTESGAEASAKPDTEKEEEKSPIDPLQYLGWWVLTSISH